MCKQIIKSFVIVYYKPVPTYINVSTVTSIMYKIAERCPFSILNIAPFCPISTFYEGGNLEMRKNFPPSRIHRHAVATMLFEYSSKDSSSSPVRIWPQIKGRTVCRSAKSAGGLFYLACGQLAFSLLWTVILSALYDLP